MIMRNLFPINFPKCTRQCFMPEKKGRCLSSKTLNWCDSRSMENKKNFKMKTKHRIQTRNGKNVVFKKKTKD